MKGRERERRKEDGGKVAFLFARRTVFSFLTLFAPSSARLPFSTIARIGRGMRRTFRRCPGAAPRPTWAGAACCGARR